VAIEIDSITARILQYLYPNAKVFNQGFEETALPNDYFCTLTIKFQTECRVNC
jgi:hypothetical protein